MFKKSLLAFVASMSMHFVIVVYCSMKYGYYMNKDTVSTLNSESAKYEINSYYLDVPLNFIFKYEGFLSWWVEWYEKSLVYLDNSQFTVFFQYQFYAVYVFIGYITLITAGFALIGVLAYIGSFFGPGPIGPGPKYSHHYDSQGKYIGYTQY